MILGLPLVLMFSWVYELTPEGLKKQHEVDRSQSVTPETGRKLNNLIGLWRRWRLWSWRWTGLCPKSQARFRRRKGARRAGGSRRRPKPPASVIPVKSIAVLPFVDMSPAKEQEYFADGITEEVLNLIGETN